MSTHDSEDGFFMVPIFEESITKCFRIVHEQPSEEAVLFSGDPIATNILPDKNDRRWSQRRFIEFLHGWLSWNEMEARAGMRARLGCELDCQGLVPTIDAAQ